MRYKYEAINQNVHVLSAKNDVLARKKAIAMCGNEHNCSLKLLEQ